MITDFLRTLTPIDWLMIFGLLLAPSVLGLLAVYALGGDINTVRDLMNDKP